MAINTKYVDNSPSVLPVDCRIVQLPSNLFLCDVYHIFSDLLLTGIEFSKIYFTIDRYEILII